LPLAIKIAPISYYWKIAIFPESSAMVTHNTPTLTQSTPIPVRLYLVLAGWRFLCLRFLCFLHGTAGLLLWCALLPGMGHALAADKVLDVALIGQEAVSLAEYFSVLQDNKAGLTLDEVQQPALASRFQSAQPSGSALNFGYTRSAWWLRLSLSNTSSQPAMRMLEIPYSALSHVAFHQPLANTGNSANRTEPVQYRSINTGSIAPFASRAWPNRLFVFPVTVPPQSSQVYFFRVQAHDVLMIPARIWQPAAYAVYERNDYFVQAWFFGMATAMLLFNLLLFLSIRDSIFLWYVSWVSCGILAVSAYHGLAQQFLWPGATQWSDMAHFFGWSLSLASLVMFTRCMLDTATQLPSVDKLLKAVAAIHLASPLGFAISFQPLVVPVVLFYGATLTLIAAVGLFGSFKRKRSARFFMLAFSPILLGAIINLLKVNAVLPSNTLTDNALQFGSAMQLILLALALADRFNQHRRERAKTYAAMQVQRDTLHAQAKAQRAQEQMMQAQAKALKSEQALVETLKSSEQVLEQRVAQRTAELSLAGMAADSARQKAEHARQEAETARQEAEAAEQKAISTLADLRATQANLIQSEKMAGLGTLTAGVAHEINNPTNFTHVAAQNQRADLAEFEQFVMGLLKDDADPATVAEFTRRFGTLQRNVATMLNGTERIKTIVKDLRSFTRLDEAEKKTVPLSECLNATLHLVRSAWLEKVDFMTEYGSDPPCECWPALLNQVFMNLLLNACQAVDGKHSANHEKGRVWLRLRQVPGALVAEIEDNGSGIDPEVMPRILEPFFSTKGVGSGTGLGLTTSYGIIQKHHGRLEVVSTPGQGSCFAVHLPLNK
jgi:signal transduction histidine kinase